MYQTFVDVKLTDADGKVYTLESLVAQCVLDDVTINIQVSLEAPNSEAAVFKEAMIELPQWPTVVHYFFVGCRDRTGDTYFTRIVMADQVIPPGAILQFNLSCNFVTKGSVDAARACIRKH